MGVSNHSDRTPECHDPTPTPGGEPLVEVTVPGLHQTEGASGGIHNW